MTIATKGTMSREAVLDNSNLKRLKADVERLKADNAKQLRYLRSAKFRLDQEAAEIQSSNPKLTRHQAFAKACDANRELYLEVRREEREE